MSEKKAMEDATASELHGEIIAIEGSVVDVFFPAGVLGVEAVLISESDPPTVIDVAEVIGDDVARGIVLNPHDGLYLGMRVRDTGKLPEPAAGAVLPAFHC